VNGKLRDFSAQQVGQSELLADLFFSHRPTSLKVCSHQQAVSHKPNPLRA
jgi:hypothetical protein